jgi:hypothetical protein
MTGTFGCHEKFIERHEDAQNLRCLYVPINNVDNILKVRSCLGQIMKFTYHPLIKSSID